MKEKLAQLQKTFNEGLELLKEQKVDEAIAKMAEVAPLFKEMETADEESMQKIQKTEDESKANAELLKTAQEELKKWADMFISADNVTQLLQDLSSIKEFLPKIADLQKKVEDMEKIAISKQVGGDTEVKKTREDVLKTVKLG